MFKTIQILCIGLIASFILSACGKKEEPAPPAKALPAEPALTAGGASAELAVPAEPIPEGSAKPATSAQSIPKIANNVEYPEFRKKLIGSGWSPAIQKQSQDCGIICQEKRRSGFIETQVCADTGLAPCIFIFKNSEGKILKIQTVGENLLVEKTFRGK